jgi:hypothetical protein
LVQPAAIEEQRPKRIVKATQKVQEVLKLADLGPRE